MAWDVCPQIFAQSRRRWSSNWYSSHLAEFQSINYFRFFSEVIECNCDSFALINRMQMPRWGNTMPATVVASRLEVISKTKAYADSLCADLHCSLAVPFKRSLSLPHLSLSLSIALILSRGDWQSLWRTPPISSRSKSNMTVRTVDIMENVRRERYCTHTQIAAGLIEQRCPWPEHFQKPAGCATGCTSLFYLVSDLLKPPLEQKPPETWRWCEKSYKTDKKEEPWPIAGRVSALSLIN